MIIFYVLGILSLILIAHELGHFLMAKYFKLPVLTAQIGFGPKLINRSHKETRYLFGVFPLGGKITYDVESFNQLPTYKRALIIVAGPAANVCLAVVFSFFAYSYGMNEAAYLHQDPVIGHIKVAPVEPQPENSLRLGDIIVSIDNTGVATWSDIDNLISTLSNKQTVAITVTRNSSMIRADVPMAMLHNISPGHPVILDQVFAQSAGELTGLKSGDRILQFNHETIHSWSQLVEMIQQASVPTQITWKDSNGGYHQGSISPLLVDDRYQAGITPHIEQTRVSKNPLEALMAGIEKSLMFIMVTISGIAALIFSASLTDLGGPIAVAQTFSMAFTIDPSLQLQLIAFISVQIGLINLVPLPALDGGQLVLLGYEKVRRRQPSVRMIAWYNRIGAAAFSFLLMFVIFNDVKNLTP